MPGNDGNGNGAGAYFQGYCRYCGAYLVLAFGFFGWSKVCCLCGGGTRNAEESLKQKAA